MITNSKIAYHPHNHQRCIDVAMARADTLCQSLKVRLTPMRKQVLGLIWRDHNPLGAYAIMDLLSEQKGKRIMPPTVYRALEFLLEYDLVHRLASQNAYIGCPFVGSKHQAMFMICRQCGAAAEYTADSVTSAIGVTAQRTRFQVSSRVIEVSGLCPRCQ